MALIGLLRREGRRMISREAIEAREDRELAPYAMRSAASRGRVHKEPAPELRTVYQRDRDRVIHSTAFRRLEYKTQVFVNHEGDHYRTRLTHTMEVAQIGRTIARCLDANEDLVEAIALAHDVGHTPFGHSGEEVLRELMKDHGGFEHNIHGLRVVDILENEYPDFPGLNLTYEVREAIAKHSTAYDSPSVLGFQPKQPPTLEAQIVEVADSIAYDSHDVDDGLLSGLLNEKDLLQQALPNHASKCAGSLFTESSSRRMQEGLSRLRRRQLVRHLINLIVSDLVEATATRLREVKPRSPDDLRNLPERVVCFSARIDDEKKQLETYLLDHFYRHYRVARMAWKARRFVREIFTAYVDDPRQLPTEYQKRMKDDGEYRVVCDYVAGMTDRYAQQEYLRLFAPFEKV
jgi:dGTPase